MFHQGPFLIGLSTYLKDSTVQERLATESTGSFSVGYISKAPIGPIFDDPIGLDGLAAPEEQPYPKYVSLEAGRETLARVLIKCSGEKRYTLCHAVIVMLRPIWILLGRALANR